MRVAEQGERLGLDQRYSYVPEGACRLLPESDRLPRVVARESQFGQPEQRSGLDQPVTGGAGQDHGALQRAAARAMPLVSRQSSK